MIPAIHPFAGAFAPMLETLLRALAGVAVASVVAMTVLVARAARPRRSAPPAVDLVKRRLPRAA